MIYYFLNQFAGHIKFLNVAHYITFRAIVALLSALFLSFFLSPWFINKLIKKQLGQVIREDGPKGHHKKAGTPTMGGGLILFSVLLSAFAWIDLKNIYFWLAAAVFLGYGVLGFIDDYRKISKKNSRGVSGRHKLLWQILIAGAVCSLHYYLAPKASMVHMPFFKNLAFDFGLLYIPFSIFIIVGTSNAVNLTDGLDGLAIGPIIIASSCYAILSYVSGNSVIADYLHFPFVESVGELSIFAACLIGAGLGFLWYNTYPAQVFMGDIGSLPLGGALGAIAIFSKHEFLLVIVGGVFVLEALSVITQVASFKLTGKRIFRMAPIHHHFELKGWAEPKVIVRFWIISIILGLLALLSLKIR